MTVPNHNFKPDGASTPQGKDTKDPINQSSIGDEFAQFDEPTEPPSPPIPSENEFPTDVFPSPFKELIEGANKALNFPTDYTGSSILSAVSTAIGKSAIMQVKSGWLEYASLYMSIVGKPGASKSHPIALAYKPYKLIDKQALDLFQEDLDTFNEYMAIPEKDRSNAPKVNKPILVKTVLSDFTPEILCQRLADNDRGCAVKVDELATFMEGMNQYSKGDQASTYLSFWSNQSTSIDRVKNPIPIWLPEPYLNIIGSLQPRILPKLFPANKCDNGFLQRFLFAFPANAEKQPINDVNLPNSLMEKYTNWIKVYLMRYKISIDPSTNEPTKPIIYRWSPEAKQYYFEWQAECTKEVNRNSESIKGEILSKFDIHFVRLALVLQIMISHEDNIVSLQAAEGAAKLCNYFLHNALKVVDLLNKPATTQDKVNQLKFYEALPNEFTTAQANDVGQSFGFDIKAVQRFVKQGDYFNKLSHGNYSKKVNI